MHNFEMSVILGSVLLLIITFYFYKILSFWKKKGVPYKEPHWLIGSFVDSFHRKISIGQEVNNLYKHFADQPFFGTWEFHSPTLIVRDLKIINDIFNKSFSTWSSRGIAINDDVDPLAAHLVNLDGKRWQIIRKNFAPTFTCAQLKLLQSNLFECEKNFEDYLTNIVSENKPIDAKEVGAYFTINVIVNCFFGIKDNGIFNNLGKKMFEISSHRQFLRIIQKGLPRVFRWLKLSKHSKELTDAFLQITKEVISLQSQNVELSDFMKRLLDLLKNDELEFNNKHLAAQIFGFFGAGFETSATAICCCLHELAVNQHVQERLRLEIKKQKNIDNGKITWNGLKEIKYLNMVFQETLRKYPPIPVLSRQTNKAYRIPNHEHVEIPAKINCIIPIYAIHHDSKYYPDPEKFDPLRFSDDVKHQRPTCSFLPFGNGPRFCMGSKFAEQQVKLAIVRILEKFEINRCEESEVPLQIEPSARFLVPKNKVYIKLEFHK